MPGRVLDPQRQHVSVPLIREQRAHAGAPEGRRRARDDYPVHGPPRPRWRRPSAINSGDPSPDQRGSLRARTAGSSATPATSVRGEDGRAVMDVDAHRQRQRRERWAKRRTEGLQAVDASRAGARPLRRQSRRRASIGTRSASASSAWPTRNSCSGSASPSPSRSPGCLRETRAPARPCARGVESSRACRSPRPGD